MSVELEKKIIETYRTLKASNTQLTPDADIIVPDSKPDVGEVVLADVLPMINEKRVQKDYITVSGNIDYRILYLSDEKDSSPRLKSINTRVPFTHQLEASGVDDSAFAGVKCDVVHVAFDAVNSRKINIKSVIDFECNIIKPTEFEAVVSAMEESVPCKNTPVRYSSLCAFAENEFELSGIFSAPSGIIGEILKVDTSVAGSEVSVSGGKLIAKGVSAVSVLYEDDNGSINSLEGEMPFTQVLSIDSVTEDMISEVEYSLSDMEYSLCADDDGDMTSIEIRTVLNAEASVFDRRDEYVTEDLYSPEFELAVYSEKTIVSNISCDSFDDTSVKESISLSRPGETVKIYNTTVKPYVDNVKTSGSSAEISGTADVYITCITSVDSDPVYTQKAEIPFSRSVSIGKVLPNSQVSVLCRAENSVCTMTNPANAEVKFNLTFETKVTDLSEISYVTDAEENTDVKIDKSASPSIVIYFASKGEKLWDITKRYRTTAEKLSRANGVEFGEVLDKDMHIMIPR